MACAEANGITLTYEEAGAADAPVLLVIHGQDDILIPPACGWDNPYCLSSA